MSLEVSGKIKFIGAEQEVSATFKKRELVVTTEEQYPQHISINFLQDKTELLDRFRVDDQVKVLINLRGREWVNPQGETKYFNDIQGWRIESLNAESGTHTPTAQASAPQANQSNSFVDEDDDGNPLPF